ncbi:acetate--CoA ligase family protein [Streptomyces sp. NPDC057690]|uniref:acetate--CoA ligase family protein n=1 Tax=Streptomyces sp. NPDC057690 TaxID=3346214 RepID=UPI0036BECD7C
MAIDLTTTSPAPTDDGRAGALDRVLHPRTVAVVGISDASKFGSGVRRSLVSETEFCFVHPKAEEVFGHPVFPDLRAIGRPVDAVFSAVGAERTVDVVEQAAEIGAGGVITIAGGFAEVGAHGAELQQRMVAAARAAGMPVVGPNGVGVINVARRLDLTMLAPFERRPGGLSAVTHSGAMIEAMASAAWRAGGVGLNLLVSAGNEAVTDLADYLDHFAADPATRVIALALEKIRRPDAFFAAAGRCLAAGKPIVALKLGRSERAQRMAASHTGTLTGDAWVYDVAFAQAGIQTATDIDDLVDRVQFLEQLPRERWSPVRGLAVLTVTGGFAQLASDLAEVEKVDVPEVTRLRPFIEENVPGGTVPNPLDATTFVGGVDGLWEKIVREYADAPEFDALLFASQHADWDQGRSDLSDRFADVADEATAKPFVVAPLAGLGGAWLDEYRARGVAVGNGLRGCLRGLHTMAAVVRTRPDALVRPARDIPAIPRPRADTIDVAEGRMLPFDATMNLLAAAGIPVAPWHLVDANGPVIPPFKGPYVVKLADVPHRTELGVVRVGVAAEDLETAVEELRAIAAACGQPSRVAVQPLLAGHGEAFVGINGAGELGPVVAFGLGGVFVEVMRRVAGRMAPMSDTDAEELVAEFDDIGVIDGFRGAPAWDRRALTATLVAASRLAAGGRDWIGSIDINPLIVGPDGVTAVDGLCLTRNGQG